MFTNFSQRKKFLSFHTGDCESEVEYIYTGWSTVYIQYNTVYIQYAVK